MSFFKKDILGIDLGARTLKGVRLKKGKDGKVRLTHHFFHDLALTSQSFPECNRAEAFKAAIETQGLKQSPSAAAVKDKDVMSFTLNLPAMSEKELRQVVPQEIAEQAHIAIDDHSCDYLVSPRNNNTDATTVRAYCVKKQIIVDQMQYLREAGLKPKSIESEMMAITTMLNFNSYLNKKEVCVVIDLGEDQMVSGLIAEGELVLTQSNQISFGTINMALQTQFNISYEDAEKIKLEFDFLLGPTGQLSDLTEAVETAFAEVFKSIKVALEFYKECPESMGHIDKVFLIGGGSQIKSVAQIIETFFKIPAQVVNPFRNVDIFSGYDEEMSQEIAALAPFMGTAVGLALNTIEEEKAG